MTKASHASLNGSKALWLVTAITLPFVLLLATGCASTASAQPAPASQTTAAPAARVAQPWEKNLAKVEAEAQALLVVKGAIAGSHTGNIADFEKYLHFPHVRLASGTLEVIERPGVQAPNLLSFMEGGRWRYSTLERFPCVLNRKDSQISGNVIHHGG
jgi:hypothetical protein